MTPVYKLSASSIKGRTNYGSMLAGNPVYTPPSWYDSLATVTVGSGGASSVEFTSIPGTYAHLQIRTFARSTANQASEAPGIQFNNDTGSNYLYHKLYGTGSVAGSTRELNLDRIAHSLLIPAATNTANTFGAAVIDILDYANTNKFTTTRSLAGYETNGGTEQQVELQSGLWRSTAAITSIKIVLNGNFTQYSHFALYGIKSA